MLQRLFKKKSSNPSPDKADSPVAPTQSADQSIDLAQALSMASQYYRAGQFSKPEAAYRQIPRTEQKYVEIALAHGANLPKLSQVRRELRDRMTSRPENNPQHFTRSLESAYRESWRKWCESPGVV
jgi:Predicted O-linked N-acetylglucosamine transferase, SPINDLY family